jgi:CBS domain-containing protein
MKKAKDIMTRTPYVVAPETEIAEAARLLIEKKVNGIPVVDAMGTLVGILCQSDLVRLQKKFPIPSVFTLLDGILPIGSLARVESELSRISATTVAEAMTPEPQTITPETRVDEIATLMVDQKLHTLPVVEEGTLVGVVGKEDVLRTLYRE